MGHLGFLIAGGATAPPGAIFMVESYFMRSMFGSMPPEIQAIIGRIFFGFWVAGLILLIVGSALLIVGLIKYKNRYGKYEPY